MVDPTTPTPLGGFEIAQDFFERWRDHASAITRVPAHLNWFFRMDPQIAMSYGDAAFFVEQYPNFVERVRRAGDGLGVHPHAWRWDRNAETWIADLASNDFARECLDTAVGAFRTALGQVPELLRFGDAFLTDEIVDAAERAGIRYDLTLEPGRPARELPETAEGERATGWLPDWRRAPRHPYFPAHDDYQRPLAGTTRPIRLIPLSTGPRWLGSSIRGRVAAIRAHGPRDWKQRDILYMALPHWSGPDNFGDVLARTVALQRRPYLAFGIRTDWGLRRDRRRNIERCLGELLHQQERHNLVFCTPAEACAILDERPVTEAEEQLIEQAPR